MQLHVIFMCTHTQRLKSEWYSRRQTVSLLNYLCLHYPAHRARGGGVGVVVMGRGDQYSDTCKLHTQTLCKVHRNMWDKYAHYIIHEKSAYSFYTRRHKIVNKTQEKWRTEEGKPQLTLTLVKNLQELKSIFLGQSHSSFLK